MALCATSTTTFTIACALQCSPVSYAWTQGDGQSTGTCVNIRALAFTQAAANLTLDVMIMITPMPILYKLHVDWKKKIQIMIMFSFGIIIIVVCIIRLHLFVRDFDTDNPTSDFWALLVWDAAEAFVSIYCVCLPAAKYFFQHIFAWLATAIRERSFHQSWSLHSQSRQRSGLPGSEKEDKDVVRRTHTTIKSEKGGKSALPSWAMSFNSDETQCSRTSATFIPKDDVIEEALPEPERPAEDKRELEDA